MLLLKVYNFIETENEFSFFNGLFVFISCTCMLMCCMHARQLWRQEVGSRCPGAGLPKIENNHVDGGNQTQVLWRSTALIIKTSL